MGGEQLIFSDDNLLNCKTQSRRSRNNNSTVNNNVCLSLISEVLGRVLEINGHGEMTTFSYIHK